MLIKHNTIIFTLLTFIFILVSVILIQKTFTSQQENFSTYSLRRDADADNSNNFTVTESGTFERAVINNISDYMLLQNPIPEKDPLVFLEFNTQSQLKILRKEENQEKEFTVGFYLAKPDILDILEDSDYTQVNTYNATNNLLTLTDKNDDTVLTLQLLVHTVADITTNKIKVVVNGVIDDSEDGYKLQDENNLSYVVLSLNYNSNDFIPDLKININNKIYTIKLSTYQAQKLNIKKFIFGEYNSESANNPNGFTGYIGSVTIFNKNLDKFTLCQYFNCDISCYIPPRPDEAGFKTYDGNVNGCIKDCMLQCDNIERCQKICVNCEVEGQYWSEEEKNERCPWLSEIKITDMSVPEAPEIRGFPGDRSILIEWKKPFDGRSYITNYIVMYYESFDRSKGIQVSISGKSTDDIYEHEIKNLKNRTHYDIVVRAVNSQGIGKPSNIITISPDGNMDDTSSSNIYNNMENEVDREINKMTFDFVCDNVNYDSVGHTLDYYDEDAMDIKNYIKNIK